MLKRRGGCEGASWSRRATDLAAADDDGLDPRPLSSLRSSCSVQGLTVLTERTAARSARRRALPLSRSPSLRLALSSRPARLPSRPRTLLDQPGRSTLFAPKAGEKGATSRLEPSPDSPALADEPNRPSASPLLRFLSLALCRCSASARTRTSTGAPPLSSCSCAARRH